MNSTPNSVAPMFKWALLPSLLAASLAVSACQDRTAPADAASDVAVDASDEALSDDEADMATPKVGATTMSTDEQMIDNLASYRWTLERAIDDNQQPIAPLMDIKDQVSLRFNQNQGQNSINYSVGCNTISANYELKDAQLITEEGMSTKMSCPDLNEAENRLNTLMQGDSKLMLDKDKPAMLTQTTDDAVTLFWSGRMTAQAKYNSKGETLFWAVSADTVPCTDNESQMCLQVKPITYNDQGIKTSEGEWTQFAGTIDGYQHDGTHDEVLRLQRYDTDTDTVLVDNVDSNHAYVLDTVIESTVAQ